MKSKTPTRQTSKKGFFRKAGEVLGTIGHEIAEGKDKVVAASHNVIDSITGLSKPAAKKAVKKTIRKVVKKKIAPVKKAVVKTAKKAVKKITKKAVKAAPKKKQAN